MFIRKAILGAATALALASPAAASDLPVAPYTSGPTYERETHTYEHRTAPRVVVAEPAPIPTETIIVRRPVVVLPPRVVVEDILSMQHHECMPRLLCMRTRVRGGVTDGTIATFTAGGNSDSQGSRLPNSVMASDMRAFWPTAGLSEPPMPRLVPSFIWRDSSASRTASWMNVVQADISEARFHFALSWERTCRHQPTCGDARGS